MSATPSVSSLTEVSQNAVQIHTGHSPTIGAIAAAVAKAQLVMEPAVKDMVNPHFGKSYASLASVWAACHTPFNTQEIALVQDLSTAGTAVTCVTRMVHASGEFFDNTLTMFSKDTAAQSIGSTMTYARRYGLSALTGVVAEDDDDGEAAVGRPATQTITAPPRAAPPPQTTRLLRWTSRNEMEVAFAAVKGKLDESTYLRVLAAHGVKPDLPRDSKMNYVEAAYDALSELVKEKEFGVTTT